MLNLESDTITFLHPYIMGGYFVGMCSQSEAYKLKPHMMMQGLPATGKSKVVDMLEQLMVKGTTFRMVDMTDRSFHTTNGHDYSLKLCLVDEIPPQLLGRDHQGKVTQGAEGLKSAITAGFVEYSSFEWDGTNVKSRKTRLVKNDARFCIVGGTNLGLLGIAEAFISRFMFRPVAMYQRAGYTKQDQETYASWQDAQAHQKNVDRFYKRCQWAQAISMFIEQLIHVKFLPEPDMATCKVCFSNIMMELKNKGMLSVVQQRRIDQLIQVARKITIWYAAHVVYLTNALEEIDYLENETNTDYLCRTIHRVVPYLFCTMEIAMFAVTQFFEQFADPLETSALEAKLDYEGFYDPKRTSFPYMEIYSADADPKNRNYDFNYWKVSFTGAGEEGLGGIARDMKSAAEKLSRKGYVTQSDETIISYLKQLERRTWLDPDTRQEV